MKKNILLFLFLAPALIFAQPVEKINWVTIEEAVELQKENPKKIIMDVYTKWCGPCKMMANNTFMNDDVAAYINENYYAVKFDAESPDSVHFKGKVYANPTYNPQATGRNGVNEFARYLNVGAYPTLVFMDEDANFLGPVTGYRTPQQLEIFLKYFAEGKYETIRTPEQWQEYESTFTGTFK